MKATQCLSHATNHLSMEVHTCAKETKTPFLVWGLFWRGQPHSSFQLQTSVTSEGFLKKTPPPAH